MKSSSSSSAEASPLRFLVLGVDSAPVRRLVAQLEAQGIQAHAAVGASPLDPTHPAETQRLPVLLLGLPAQPQPSQMAADQALREALHQSGRTFLVLCGDANAQLSQALRLAAHPASASAPPSTLTSTGGWHAMCEACSDPDCERRLFHALNIHRDSKTLPGKP